MKFLAILGVEMIVVAVGIRFDPHAPLLFVLAVCIGAALFASSVARE